MKFLLALALLCSITVQSQAENVCPLKVGETIPKGTVYNLSGDAEQLQTLTEKPSVIVFYRGAWCGYCIKHLADLNDIKDDINDLGYTIFGISVDQVSKLKESQTKSETEFPVYSDANAELITAFGLDWKVADDLYNKYKNDYKLDLEAWSGNTHHNLPVPAIFVVKDGVVQFQYVNPNYSTRLKPETLLTVLKTL